MLHLYVFYRLHDLPFFKNRIGQVALVAAGVLLWLVFFLGRLYGGHGYGAKDSAIMLLSHTPWMVEAAAAAGADLMISGHTHNGQIWPFSYLVKTRYPYIRGCYEVSGMTLVVSRGTGTWGPRMRLWSAGEISLITLRAALN